jgi:putative FmdB family regulatory protein
MVSGGASLVMPLYEYQCDACQNRFERIQKFSDPPIDVCPACGGPVRKLLSSPAIQFKGTGWYITDYAKKGGSDGAKSKGTDKSSTDGASTSTTDSGSSSSSTASTAGSSTSSAGTSDKS